MERMVEVEKKNWAVDAFLTNADESNVVAQFKKVGFDQFQSMEIPTRRVEDWKYTSVAPIFKNQYQRGTFESVDFSNYHFGDLEAIYIYVVNGVIDTDKSMLSDLPKGLQIMPVHQALEHEETKAWIDDINNQASTTQQNVFLPLNTALSQSGLVVIVEKNAVIDLPVHIIHLQSQSNHHTSPQLYVKSEQGSSATIIESFDSTEDAREYFTNIANRVDVAKNAQLTHYKIQLECESAHQICNTIVRQDRDSVYTSHVADLGGKLIRNNLSTELLDSNTLTNYFGIYIGLNEQHIDNQTFIDHAVPYCDSNELYKGILTDKARGVFNGKVLVRQDAQKTNAFQQNSSLVLSPTAMMDAKPQLEIFADDVKCSHGATIGQLDEGSIFYLRSRGIPHQQALTLLQKAFIGEVIMKMKIPQVKDALLGMVYRKLTR